MAISKKHQSSWMSSRLCWMSPLVVATMWVLYFVLQENVGTASHDTLLLGLKDTIVADTDISKSTTKIAQNNHAETVDHVGAGLPKHNLVIPESPETTTVIVQGDYAQFVDDVVVGLRKHNLKTSALKYFLEKVATTEMAQKCEWAEFGCWSGKTIKQIAKRRQALSGKRPVHGFDSFKGLPEKWRDATIGGNKFTNKWTNEGSFNRGGKPPFVDHTLVTWHIGWFNATVTNFVQHLSADESICFVHVDADIYSSTDTIFKSIEKRLTPGTYMVFDELINYPEFAKHELKALYEMLERTGLELRLLGYAGPRIEKDPLVLRDLIVKQKGERGALPQNALVQLVRSS